MLAQAFEQIYQTFKQENQHKKLNNEKIQKETLYRKLFKKSIHFLPNECQ